LPVISYFLHFRPRALEPSKKICRACRRGVRMFLYIELVGRASTWRYGMFPRLPVYMFNADCTALPNTGSEAPLKFRKAEASGSHIATLAALDSSALGVSREKHHNYLLNDPTMPLPPLAWASVIGLRTSSSPQALRSDERIRGASTPLGRRTHLCLAQPLPKACQGLGEPQSQRADVPAACLNPPHAPKTL
jgi:hypothetical protein